MAAETARDGSAGLVLAPMELPFEAHLRAPGEFQRRNFAIACAAAEAFLGRLDPGLAAGVAASVIVPGRLELIADDPPTYVDAAHNPAGAGVLARSLLRLDVDLPVIACLAVLTDKDAPAMLRALEPALDYVVCTELPAAALQGHGRPGARSRSAVDLAKSCEEIGLPAAAEPNFEAAVKRARSPAEGTVVIAGSHYAIAPARAVLGT